MREILFRGKRIDNGEWVEGYLSQRRGSNGKIFESHIILDAYEQIGVLNFGRPGGLVSEIGHECFKVDPETVCQYTGLADKNGRKIFEGDIIQYEKKRYNVVWVDGIASFSVNHLEDGRCRPCMNSGTMKVSEVIGNIFDDLKIEN